MMKQARLSGLTIAIGVLLAPSAVRAQTSGTVQAQVRVLDVRSAPAIPAAWVLAGADRKAALNRVDHPAHPARLELQALTGSTLAPIRRVRITVTYLR